MIYYYGDKISPNMTLTPEGILICRNVPIARIGEMEYLARELKLDGDGERVVKVSRSPEEVFDPAALASFEGKFITDGHPPCDVTPENYSSYDKGHLQNIQRDGDYMVADLHIKDPTLISEVQNGVKREVSCGYNCVYEPSDDGTYRQRRIRGNHVAVVPNGRAGKSVSIKDSAPAEKKERSKPMKKSLAESFLSVFGVAAKDASPETMEQIARDAAAVLEAEPAEKAPEAAPAADVEVERAPKGDDLGSKLDKLIEMMGGLIKEEKKEPYHDEAPEEKIDKLIDEMTGETSETIEADDEGCLASADALTILRSARPAIAAIKDPVERMKVTDALLSAVRGSKPDMGKLMDATAAAAKKNAMDAAPIDYAGQQSIYDSLNPHKIKEVK